MYCIIQLIGRKIDKVVSVSIAITSLPPSKQVMLSLRSVCLSVHQITEKSCEWILTKFLGGVGHGPGTNQFNFGYDPDHRLDPGVRSPNYQRILTKFYGELGCGLETNRLHFGDDLHHYLDPRVRSGSRSGSEKNCHNSIMLAFDAPSSENHNE